MMALWTRSTAATRGSLSRPGYICYFEQAVAVADSGYGGDGTMLLLFAVSGRRWLDLRQFASQPMHRPLSVACNDVRRELDAVRRRQHWSGFPVRPLVHGVGNVHQPVPTAGHIRSMSVTAAGTLHVLDAYRRRLVILSPLPGLA